MKNMIIASIIIIGVLFYQSAYTYTWKHHIPGEMIYNIALEGNFIWCATDSGVVRYSKSDGTIVRYTEKNGLANNKVRSIAIDHNGIKWFGTGNGVSSYDDNNWTNYRLEKVRPDPSLINSIIETNDHIICFGTDLGLYTFDGKVVNHFAWGFIEKIIEDKNGLLWSAADTGGVVKGDLKGNILFLYESPNHYSYYSAAIDSNSIFWFGSDEDLLKYDGKTWESFDVYSKYNMYYIRDIQVDTNNILWLGNEFHGLYSYDGKEFIRYEDPAGYRNAIFSIKIDETGVIWTGGSNGLQSFHPDPVGIKDQNPMSGLKILKNSPNPFNPSTTIEFTLPSSGKANLTVYDIMGRKVRELVSGQVSAGMRTALWDGRDDSGKLVSSGVYFARLTMGKNVAVKKMLLMK